MELGGDALFAATFAGDPTLTSGVQLASSEHFGTVGIIFLSIDKITATEKRPKVLRNPNWAAGIVSVSPRKVRKAGAVLDHTVLRLVSSANLRR